MDVHCVVNAADQLGAGPVWSAAEGRLYWFDIQGRRLSWYEPASQERAVFDLPMRASAAVVRRNGGLLAATEQGLAAIHVARGEIRLLQRYDMGAGVRTHDGKIDMEGRFWWSVTDESGNQPGSVFRTDTTGKTTRVLSGIQVPSAVSFSPDGRTLYMADSRLQTLFAHATDDLPKVREFAHIRGQPGTPAGSAVDAEGYLWNALPGAGRIVRYSPDGRVARTIRLPVTRPTGCAFGGPGLATLFITSASEGLSPADLQREPLAGGLLAIDPGVAGLALPLFEG